MAPKPASSKRSVVQRLTGKVGPLPAWAWAVIILGAYLAYSHFHSSSSTDSSSTDSTTSGGSSDQTPVTTDSSGNPPASGGGDPTSNVSDDLLSQLSGFQGSIDQLTAAVQSSQAFEGTGGDSGDTVPVGGNTVGPPNSGPPAVKAPAAIPKPAAVAPSRYYTYAPGKAPKGQAANQAPAAGPKGTTLHFAKGKGYYYA